MVEDTRSDAQLLRDSGKNADAFGVFYDRHARAVFDYFSRRTADQGLAAELTAETFAQAFAGRRRYRKTEAPASGWLFTIAARQLNQFFRRERVASTYRGRLRMPDPTEPNDFERVDDLDVLQRRLPKLHRALEELSEQAAEAVTLRIGHGWSYADLATHLECSPAAARVRVSRALTQLEDHYQNQDNEKDYRHD